MFFKIYSVWQQDFFSLYLGCHFFFFFNSNHNPLCNFSVTLAGEKL